MKIEDMDQVIDRQVAYIAGFRVDRVPKRFEGTLKKGDNFLLMDGKKGQNKHIFYCQRVNDRFRLPISAVTFTGFEKIEDKAIIRMSQAQAISYRP